MDTLLAFDTSTERMSLALLASGRVSTHEGPGGAQASAHLIPEALRLLQAAGVGVREVQAFAFGRGPGAFTGLRTACSVAQGFAFGSARPVLPIDSLLIVAEDARLQRVSPGPDAFEVWVAMDARMNEIYAGAYRWEREGWQAIAAPALYTLDALDAAWRSAPPAVVAGSALAVFGDRLPLGAALCVPQERARAQALAALAQAAWREGRAIDAAQALPLYLRDKVALTTAERDALRALRSCQPPSQQANPPASGEGAR